MVKVLVKHGSPLDIKNGQGETPLIIALQYGCIEIASYPVSCGASIRSRDAQGSGVLSHAKDLRDGLEQRRLSICMPFSVESNAPPIKHVLKDTNGAALTEYFGRREYLNSAGWWGIPPRVTHTMGRVPRELFMPVMPRNSSWHPSFGIIRRCRRFQSQKLLDLTGIERESCTDAPSIVYRLSQVQNSARSIVVPL